ncbi:MAG: Protein-methionine-sulfoxide reductase catalytic subunit MsrP [Chlamydiae bacterium]|nr:Protein-methionine-sulfoxide reductase catalytic subunit MsrP [Chlamydiota bacterium]
MDIDIPAHFPVWLSITHFINLMFITLLIRSGIQILADHPRLYMNQSCAPDTDWIKFTKKKVPKDKYYTSMDDAVDVSRWIALPGGFHNLGAGRHWHFFCALFWMLNGFIYIFLLFFTDGWRQLVPTSWSFFPDLWQSFITILTFKLQPSEIPSYNPLQVFCYFIIVFIVAPLTMATGAAMSPAIAARFPWYRKIFGNRQIARSIHFLCMCTYILFIIGHVIFVCITGFAKNMGHIVLATSNPTYRPLAIIIGIAGIIGIIVVHYLATLWSHKKPRHIQKGIGKVTNLFYFLLHGLNSRQKYPKEAITSYFWINGYPPKDEEWLIHNRNNFKDYKLKIHGLVEKPTELSLADLEALPKTTQITEHCCIQGWSGIGEWGGVTMKTIMELCKPLPNARYAIFHSYQHDENDLEYYNTLDFDECQKPQTILAYEMNEKKLQVGHGAPLRLRIETQLGFKMTKWIRSVEFVEDFKTIGQGHGGYREDNQYFTRGAEI